VFDEIFYSECLYCSTAVKYRETICKACFSEIKKVIHRCRLCGYPLNVEAEVCKNCLESKYYDKLFIPFWYTSVVKSVLKKIKFRYNIKGYRLIDELVRKNLMKMDRYDIITYVPSTFMRRFRRFVHPAEYIANILSDIYMTPCEPLLKRVRNTSYQWRLKKKERLKNVSEAFTPKKELFDLKILLVDDIMTTGATLNECAKMLKGAGARKVDCYVLSKGLF